MNGMGMYHAQSLSVHGEELEHLELGHSLLHRRGDRHVDARDKVVKVPANITMFCVPTCVRQQGEVAKKHRKKSLC